MSDAQKLLLLLTRADAHCRTLEKLFSQLRREIPFYSACPELLSRQLRAQRQLLEKFQQEIRHFYPHPSKNKNS